MGYALAAAAWRRGADVVLVSGPTALAPPHGVRCVAVTSAAEMRDALLAEFDAATMLLMAAAVADYRPAASSAQKLKKQPGPLRTSGIGDTSGGYGNGGTDMGGAGQ